jgi:hypothetical protein
MNPRSKRTSAAPNHPLTLGRLTLGRRSALGALASAVFSCQYSSSPSGETPSRRRAAMPRRVPLVVLVAIDGVRWQDIYHGPTLEGVSAVGRGPSISRTRAELVPELIKMERHGVSFGAPGAASFYASGPNYVSLPGYMEMLSGTSATSCSENDCKRMKRHTLLDDFASSAPGDPTRTGAFSSWPKLEVAASRQKHGVVSTGQTGGYNHHILESLPRCREALEKGREERAERHESRHDEHTALLARAFLHEADPDFVFVSLGESDEAAHQGDYGAYLRAIQFADAFVGKLRGDLHLRRLDGRETLLLVTTDHGRASNFKDHGRKHPESSRAFLFAEGTKIRPLGRLPHGSAYLKDIAPTIREASGLKERRDEGSGRVLREILA